MKEWYYANRRWKTRTIEIGDKVVVLPKKAEQTYTEIWPIPLCSYREQGNNDHRWEFSKQSSSYSNILSRYRQMLAHYDRWKRNLIRKRMIVVAIKLIIVALTPLCRYITAVNERTFIKGRDSYPKWTSRPISKWKMY